MLLYSPNLTTGAPMGLAFIVLLATACATQQEPHNTLTAAERAAGWRLLFDGRTTAGWTGFRRDSVIGWRAEDGALVRVGPGEPESVVELKGRTVGAGGAGTAARAMRTLAGVTQVPLGKGQAGVPALEAKAIDALIVDEFDAVRAARQSNGRLRVLKEPVVLEHYAFVLPPDRTDWKRRLDEALAALEKEGRVAELEKRFGVARDAAWPVDMDR